MVPDRQKVWTDGRTEWTDGQTHGRSQNYIPLTSSGDNKRIWKCQNHRLDQPIGREKDTSAQTKTQARIQ